MPLSNVILLSPAMLSVIANFALRSKLVGFLGNLARDRKSSVPSVLAPWVSQRLTLPFLTDLSTQLMVSSEMPAHFRFAFALPLFLPLKFFHPPCSYFWVRGATRICVRFCRSGLVWMSGISRTDGRGPPRRPLLRSPAEPFALSRPPRVRFARAPRPASEGPSQGLGPGVKNQMPVSTFAVFNGSLSPLPRTAPEGAARASTATMRDARVHRCRPCAFAPTPLRGFPRALSWVIFSMQKLRLSFVPKVHSKRIMLRLFRELIPHCSLYGLLRGTPPATPIPPFRLR